MATASNSGESNSFVMRTVHGDVMVVSQDILLLWAYFRGLARK